MKILSKKNKLAVFMFQSIYIFIGEYIIAKCKEENLTLDKWEVIKKTHLKFDKVLYQVKRFEKKIESTHRKSNINDLKKNTFKKDKIENFFNRVNIVHLNLINQPLDVNSFTTTSLLERFPVGTHINDIYDFVNKERNKLKLPLFKRQNVSFSVQTLTHTFVPKKTLSGQMKLRK